MYSSYIANSLQPRNIAHHAWFLAWFFIMDTCSGVAIYHKGWPLLLFMTCLPDLNLLKFARPNLLMISLHWCGSLPSTSSCQRNSWKWLSFCYDDYQALIHKLPCHAHIWLIGHVVVACAWGHTTFCNYSCFLYSSLWWFSASCHSTTPFRNRFHSRNNFWL